MNRLTLRLARGGGEMEEEEAPRHPTHSVLSRAYDQPPLNWPASPTQSQFTLVHQADSASMGVLRSRTSSREQSPGSEAFQRSILGAASQPGRRKISGDDDDFRRESPAIVNSDPYDADGPPSSSDEEMDGERTASFKDGGSWSASGGSRDGSFKKQSPDAVFRRVGRSPSSGSEQSVFALAGSGTPRASPGGPGGARPAGGLMQSIGEDVSPLMTRPPAMRSTGSGNRKATLAALSGFSRACTTSTVAVTAADPPDVSDRA